jgi:hypothetical protein
MKKPIVFVFIFLIFGGGMAAYYGFNHENSVLAGLGVVVCGVGVFILGVDTLIRRESIEQDEVGYVSTYRGCSAIFIGVLWALIGIIVVISGFVILIGQQKHLLQWLTEHPGLALVAVGLVLLAYGGQEVLGSEEQRSSFLAILFSLPPRLFGLLMIVGGLALLAAGVLEILFPAVFQGMIVSIQFWWKDLQCQIQPAFCTNH